VPKFVPIVIRRNNIDNVERILWLILVALIGMMAGSVLAYYDVQAGSWDLDLSKLTNTPSIPSGNSGEE
jgi:hypothetical protein